MRTLLFSSRRWLLTLIVFVLIVVFISLGIWQIERLGQRRALNDATRAQIDAAPLVLAPGALPPDLGSMEYRAVTVTGEYDAQHSLMLRNQVWQNRPGLHLVTPLRLAGGAQAVLIDRGWLPLDQAAPDKWEPYAQSGTVTVHGVLRASRSTPAFVSAFEPAPAPGQPPIAWTTVDIARIAAGLPYALLPVYVQQLPDPAHTQLPYPVAPAIDLSEGSHLAYAIQWFSFALVLGAGYVVWLRRTPV